MNEKTFAKLSQGFKEAHEFYSGQELAIYLCKRRKDADAIGLVLGLKRIQRFPIGSLLINRAGSQLKYEVVEIGAVKVTAKDELLRLCREAGAKLSLVELQKSGVDPGTTPELRWIGYLVYTLENEHLPYLKQVDIENKLMGSRLEYEKIIHPFLASAKAIELAGLLGLDANGQSSDNQYGSMAEGSVAVGNPPVVTFVLQPDDVLILQELKKAHTTLDQYSLEEKTRLSRKNISTRLRCLREAGLTCRPKGNRGGEAITEAGRTELSRHDALITR